MPARHSTLATSVHRRRAQAHTASPPLFSTPCRACAICHMCDCSAESRPASFRLCRLPEALPHAFPVRLPPFRVRPLRVRSHSTSRIACCKFAPHPSGHLLPCGHVQPAPPCLLRPWNRLRRLVRPQTPALIARTAALLVPFFPHYGQ